MILFLKQNMVKVTVSQVSRLEIITLQMDAIFSLEYSAMRTSVNKQVSRLFQVKTRNAMPKTHLFTSSFQRKTVS